MNPRTLPEWAQYVQTIPGPELRSKVIAANTQCFVDCLLADGMPMGEIRQVMGMFVQRLVAEDILVPVGGVFDLPGILATSRLK